MKLNIIKFFLVILLTATWLTPNTLYSQQLSITKESLTTGPFVTPGQTFSYQITIENTGSECLTGVELSDLLPDGLSFVAGSVNINIDDSAADPAQTITDNFTANGTFVMPLNVCIEDKKLTVEAWGAGGGGGSSFSSGGGGGGAYARSLITANPGDNFSVVVAQNSTAESNGGNSVFGNNIVVAAGGQAGQGSGSVSGTGGSGGSASASTGNVTFSGGSGGDADSGRRGGGGGGGSATASANGSSGANGTNNAGGAGGDGEGSGGDGADPNNNDGSDGLAPGGGGGGSSGPGNPGTSGGGARGEVRVSYNIVPFIAGSNGTTTNNLLSGYTLAPGTIIEVVFDVVVDDPPTKTEFENLATANSDQTSPVTDTAFNELDSGLGGEDAFSLILTGGPCWRTLTSPIAGQTYATFMQRFETPTGNFGGLWTQGVPGARAPNNGTPNVYTMNANGNTWVPVSDLDDEIPAGTGFLMTVFNLDDFALSNSGGFPKTAIFGDTEEQNLPFTLTLDGSTTSGTSSVPGGFSMLGNPFKTTIDFDELEKTGLESVFWIYDRNGAGPTNGSSGGWISWNGTNGDITDGLIEPGQGFVVENTTSSESRTVGFTEASKSTTSGTFYGKEIHRPDFVRLEITGEELYSSMWLEFAENGSTSRTNGDALQLLPFEENYALFSSIKDETLFDIGRFPSLVEEIEVPVTVEVTKSGTYTIRATDMMLPAGAELYLHDLQTGDRVLIADGMEYTFRINQVAKRAENSCFTAPQKAKASVENRFMITTADGMENPGTLPSDFRLSQNYPNPFNPATQIRYELPRQSDVRLEVFDMTGRQVATLVEGQVAAGMHTVTFDATNLSSGVYIYRLQAGGLVISKKLTLIK